MLHTKSLTSPMSVDFSMCVINSSTIIFFITFSSLYRIMKFVSVREVFFACESGWPLSLPLSGEFQLFVYDFYYYFLYHIVKLLSRI